MPAPATPAPLPPIAHLPITVAWIAEYCLARAPSPDHLFLLADAVEQLHDRAHGQGPGARACKLLADELRHRAPGYA